MAMQLLLLFLSFSFSYLGGCFEDLEGEELEGETADGEREEELTM